jgi:hypothetical protein
LVPNHALNGTPEFAYGMTDWWEVGFYIPFAVSGGGAFLSNGAKFRSLFAVPHAGERNFFYGINFEVSYETPPFSQTRFASEIRPIVGVRNKEWEFIVNPIVDIGFGALGEPISCPRQGWHAISATTASSASNTTPIWARLAIFCRSNSNGISSSR